MIYFKWCIIVCFSFIASILSVPIYVLCCWIDRPESERFLDLIGEGLKSKMIDEFGDRDE